jgi:hypothetical protein
MRQIKLYLDEDVNPLLARDLSQRGYDAVSTIRQDVEKAGIRAAERNPTAKIGRPFGCPQALLDSTLR